MLDEKALDEQLRDIRRTLEADGFHLQAQHASGRLRITITSDPGSCADCIVPEPVLQQILHNATGVPTDRIDLTYPSQRS